MRQAALAEVPLPSGDRMLLDLEDWLQARRHKWHAIKGYPARWKVEPGKARVKVFLHRELLGLLPGDGQGVDHINGNPLDNRRANLRLCTQAENLQNRRAAPTGSSRFRGVSLVRGKWESHAKLNGKQHYLGRYDDEEEAGAVAAAWRAEHMPFSREAA